MPIPAVLARPLPSGGRAEATLLLPVENALRGYHAPIDPTFGRASVAWRERYDGVTEEVASGVPRLQLGRWHNVEGAAGRTLWLPLGYGANGAVLVEEPTTNVGPNPSFETNLGTIWDAQGAGTTLARVDTKALFGSWSGKVTSPVGMAGCAVHHVTSGWSPRDTITFSAYGVRESGAGWKLHVTYTVTGAVWPIVYDGPVQSSTDWVRQSWTWTIPLDATAVQLKLFAVSTAEEQGICYFDGVQWEKKPYATSFTDSTRAAESLPMPIQGLLRPEEGTIACCYKPTVPPVTASKYHDLFHWVLDAENLHEVYVGPDGKLIAKIKAANVDYFTPGSAALVQGTWYHCVFKWDRERAWLYLNGALVGSVARGMARGPLPAMAYVGSTSGGIDQADGLIDDVRIYDRALSDAEIRDLYAGLPVARGA